MRYSIKLFLNLPIIASLLFAGVLCSAEAAEKLQVVTTTTDLSAVATYIGGDKADVISLATGQEDPHHIAAKPSYMIAVRDADLWIRTGMELEIGYEPLILDGSRNASIRIGTEGHLDASIGVLRLEVPSGKVDRSMGDIHPMGNPHYMLDPLNGRIVAKSIAQRMATLRPEHAAYFTERLEAFRKELDARMFGEALENKIGGSKLWALLLKGKLDALEGKSGIPALGGWLAAMKPLEGKKILPYHRNWSYFLHRFGLQAPTEVEAKPGIPPSPGRLTEVIERVKSEEIDVLLKAIYYSRQAADLIAGQTDIRIVECTMFPGGKPEVTDYFSLFDDIVKSVSETFAQPQS